MSDGIAAPVATSASLDITPVNDAPVTTPVTLAAIAEDSGPRLITQAELLANATDVDGPALTAINLAITLRQRHAGQQRQRHLELHPGGQRRHLGDVQLRGDATALRRRSPPPPRLDITPVNDAPVTTPVTLAAIAEDSGAAADHAGRAAGQRHGRGRTGADGDQPGDHVRQRHAGQQPTAPGAILRRPTTTPR